MTLILWIVFAICSLYQAMYFISIIPEHEGWPISEWFGLPAMITAFLTGIGWWTTGGLLVNIYCPRAHPMDGIVLLVCLAVACVTLNMLMTGTGIVDDLRCRCRSRQDT